MSRQILNNLYATSALVNKTIKNNLENRKLCCICKFSNKAKTSINNDITWHFSDQFLNYRVCDVILTIILARTHTFKFIYLKNRWLAHPSRHYVKSYPKKLPTSFQIGKRINLCQRKLGNPLHLFNQSPVAGFRA